MLCYVKPPVNEGGKQSLLSEFFKKMAHRKRTNGLEGNTHRITVYLKRVKLCNAYDCGHKNVMSTYCGCGSIGNGSPNIFLRENLVLPLACALQCALFISQSR